MVAYILILCFQNFLKGHPPFTHKSLTSFCPLNHHKKYKYYFRTSTFSNLPAIISVIKYFYILAGKVGLKADISRRYVNLKSFISPNTL